MATYRFKNAALSGVLLAAAWVGMGEAFAKDGKLFSFGVLADIQAGDKETKNGRYYRDSFDRLKECVDELNGHELAFTIELGDLIDGNGSKTEGDLRRVMTELNKLSMPTSHVLGNHGKSSVQKIMRRKLQSEVCYYDFTAPEAVGWRFIVLDGNDAGYGVLGSAQLAWFKSKLDAAREANEQVIAFCHYTLLKSAAPHHRMKTPQPVLDIIIESDNVAAWFAGHDHLGGYAEANGIHHVTVKGMVEAPVTNAYAIIDVYPDRLNETGFGKEPSRQMKLK